MMTLELKRPTPRAVFGIQVREVEKLREWEAAKMIQLDAAD